MSATTAGPADDIGRSTNRWIGMGREAIRGYGKATARWRPDPEFLIIGAKRGGSTSLYYDLLRHPAMAPLFPRPNLLPKAEETKGIHFFDSHYYLGADWYRSFLPSRAARAWQSRRSGVAAITGEASPYYLFHPAAAQRAAGLLPDTKILAVLRDPVLRTYSHWKERRRGGHEDLDFLDALAAEDDRIGADEERLRTDPSFRSYAHEHQSYARQSEYAPAFERWYAAYPAARILVVSSEDYYADADAVLGQVQDFLGLPRRPIASGEVRNAAAGDPIDPVVRDRLAARFAPHNQRLAELTGRGFDWS